LKQVEDHMYRHKLHESLSMRSKTINLVMNTLFEKSNREMMHSKRVSEICEHIAVELKLESDKVKDLKMAGLMHDIGKIGIPDQVLNKPEKLNSDDWDGLGYPRGLKADEISLEARIIAIADAFDAMTSYRTYGELKSKEQAVNEIRKCAGTQFDPIIVSLFLDWVLQHDIG
jgi:HD-GYP domain-containing protein (c-di-GMP phosphodiesterase class II)